MLCVDFNTFIQKLPDKCKEFFKEDCCRFTLPAKFADLKLHKIFKKIFTVTLDKELAFIANYNE